MDHDVQLDCVVKLGGSAITQKDTFETAKINEIRQAAQLIVKAQNAGMKIMVVHGAGSFGHQVASQYKVNEGFKHLDIKSQKNTKEGFSATRLSVCKLNQLVIQEFVQAGLSAVGLSPCGMWQTDDSTVVRDGVDVISTFLQEGFLPVVHGDCVLDYTLGCRVLSGDTIIQVVCKKLKPRRVVFLSDVAGVFDKPPSEQGAVHVPEILVTPGGGFTIPIQTSVADHDVTGGIRLKLSSAAQIANDSKGSIPVFICDINSHAFENAILYGDFCGHKGTLVKFANQ